MAFIAGAFIVGGAIIAHDDHSNYSDYSDHRNHRQYGDAGMVSSINNKQNEVNRLANDLDRSRSKMRRDYYNRIRQLKNERNYPMLDDFSAYSVVDYVKREMSTELDEVIAKERQELAELDRMIGKINELELKAQR